jgi:hypothetical protein
LEDEEDDKLGSDYMLITGGLALKEDFEDDD